MINLFNDAFALVLVTYIIAVVVVGLVLVVHYARKTPGALKYAWQWVKFHRGRVRAEVTPRGWREKAAFARIRWCYSRSALEPEYEQQEDRS